MLLVVVTVLHCVIDEIAVWHIANQTLNPKHRGRRNRVPHVNLC